MERCKILSDYARELYAAQARKLTEGATPEDLSSAFALVHAPTAAKQKKKWAWECRPLEHLTLPAMPDMLVTILGAKPHEWAYVCSNLDGAAEPQRLDTLCGYDESRLPAARDPGNPPGPPMHHGPAAAADVKQTVVEGQPQQAAEKVQPAPAELMKADQLFARKHAAKRKKFPSSESPQIETESKKEDARAEAGAQGALDTVARCVSRGDWHVHKVEGARHRERLQTV